MPKKKKKKKKGKNLYYNLDPQKAKKLTVTAEILD